MPEYSAPGLIRGGICSGNACFSVDARAKAALAVFGAGLDERREQWMRRERFRFEFGVELAADKPRMVGHLDDFDIGAVRRAAGDLETGGGERRFVFAIEFVAMAVALGNFGLAVGRVRERPGLKSARPRSQAHRPAHFIDAQ